MSNREIDVRRAGGRGDERDVYVNNPASSDRWDDPVTERAIEGEYNTSGFQVRNLE